MSLFITVVSILVAIAATLVAWFTVREDRRRSSARVAALIAGPEPSDDFGQFGEMRFVSEDAEPDDRTAAVDARGLFDEPERQRTVPLRPAAVAAGGLALVALVSVVWLVSQPAGAERAADKPAPALELMSLSHERRGDELTIMGLVRNPASGAELDSAHAVVSLFDEQNRFISTARSPLALRRLAPGGESSFRVTTTIPLDLGRYRVSFRRMEGGIVPHVDRRAPTATPQGHGTAPGPAPVRRAGL
jgi:hypothetical protein